MNNLTITYYTSRKDPRFEWFFDSLWKQLLEPRPDPIWPRVVVVDFFHDERKHALDDFRHRAGNTIEIIHVAPKPCVWQGPHKMTREDYFAMANARNTGICLAKDGWIAFVDDLSVLRPGWVDGVHRAIAHGHAITLGAYRKVRELTVSDGDIISCIEDPKAGVDNRYGPAGKDEPVPCPGHWLYGCSLVAPVEAFLAINGWDQRCDGLGFEDCITGIHLEKKGWGLRYDRTMMTYESEELHGQPGPPIRRADYGVSPNDKSHAILNLAREGNGWAPNDFGGKTLKELREEILTGAQFPIPRTPNIDWFRGTPLCDLEYGVTN
jgi:hypothetical protein